MRRHSARTPRALLVVLSCVLAVPTVFCLTQELTGTLTLPILMPYLTVGLILGLTHLILRPVLRLITAPLGCLTLGLSGTAIDIALIYLSASFVRGFAVPNFLNAALIAFMVNFISAFVIGRSA